MTNHSRPELAKNSNILKLVLQGFLVQIYIRGKRTSAVFLHKPHEITAVPLMAKGKVKNFYFFVKTKKKINPPLIYKLSFRARVYLGCQNKRLTKERSFLVLRGPQTRSCQANWCQGRCRAFWTLSLPSHRLPLTASLYFTPPALPLPPCIP